MYLLTTSVPVGVVVKGEMGGNFHSLEAHVKHSHLSPGGDGDQSQVIREIEFCFSRPKTDSFLSASEVSDSLTISCLD